MRTRVQNNQATGDLSGMALDFIDRHELISEFFFHGSLTKLLNGSVCALSVNLSFHDTMAIAPFPRHSFIGQGSIFSVNTAVLLVLHSWIASRNCGAD
jgi:hypothetical protein